jgi:hypothetical protein
MPKRSLEFKRALVEARLVEHSIGVARDSRMLAEIPGLSEAAHHVATAHMALKKALIAVRRAEHSASPRKPLHRPHQ